MLHRNSRLASGRRKHSRLRTGLSARLTTLRHGWTVTLVDLSFSGARIALHAKVCPGEDAVIAWGGFEAFGTILWWDGEQCGLAFDEPLAPHVLLATRDLADAMPERNMVRRAARDWVTGVNRI